MIPLPGRREGQKNISNVPSEAIWLFRKLLICAAKEKLCISQGGEIELRFVHTEVGAPPNLIKKSLDDKIFKSIAQNPRAAWFVILG